MTNDVAPSPRFKLSTLAAAIGLLPLLASAQTAPAPEATLPAISVKSRVETDASSVRATTSTIGKGNQDLRDIPQSVTVVTEKLLDERRVDTLKEALHQTAGVTFLAAEGGEEDVRLRGFSLATTGDIFVDGLRDPAFYERDTFAFDRVEVLRGSASMLFGRGSTGGVVNQVTKKPFNGNGHQVDFTFGTGEFLRFTGDFNVKNGDNAALRVNVMKTDARDNGLGVGLDKEGLAISQRWGIGTSDDVQLSGYWLRNDNGVNYGLPWLRKSSTQTSANPSGMDYSLEPNAYYGAASDVNAGGAQHLTLTHLHRFGGNGGELRTTLRSASYDRDMRASTIRYCVAPTCAGFTVPGESGPVFPTAATPLNRGTNNKVQELVNHVAQLDYSTRFKALGMTHELMTGAELTDDSFKGYATVVPAGVTLNKNAVRTTLGTPNDGTGWVDESLRIKRQQAGFNSRAHGIYAQDMLQITDTWKLVAGLRYDRMKGEYFTYQTADGAAVAPGTMTAARGRSDGLWSKRAGLLWQPSDQTSFHASWGTSFNTSGDAYQYDLPGSNTPPEGSRNIELGAKIDWLGGDLSTRFAVFHSQKTNERNRDSENGTPLEDYLLSGRRHTAGLEMDVAGRIGKAVEVFVSYAWMPIARIDAGAADGSTLTGEQVGQRPSLTPKHSGTVWATWQATSKWRLGAGLNARSSMTPNRNPAGIVSPGYVIGDLLVEHQLTPALALKFNVLNVTDRLYADALYSGHYIPGPGRQMQLTLSARL